VNNLIDKARHIPVPDAQLTVSFSPVMVKASGRQTPLELRITAPVSGDKLPIVLLSHGHGPSLYIPSKDGYGPLASFLAERGFAVIQPSHANSKIAGLPPTAPGGPMFWRQRVEELTLVIDRLGEIEANLPGLANRLDHSRIAAVGHSLGGQTVGMLLGARLTDPNDPEAQDVDLKDPRVTRGVLLAAPGNGGDDLAPAIRERYSALNPDYSHLSTKTLVVYGDADVSPHLTIRGADWHADAYRYGPGADALLTLFGAKHGLGGVAGYDAKETDDENPDRLATTRRMTWAYLWSAFHPSNEAWSKAQAALQEYASDVGQIERKAG